jgi:tyrosyl-tRNA synthetase
MGCTLQLGGSDQWGNICGGIDCMRRRDRAQGYDLVWPLLTRADGQRFGKSADGNVWLDPAQTTPSETWQFWFNTPDAVVAQLLLRLSSAKLDDIAKLTETHAAQARPAASAALGRRRDDRRGAWKLTAVADPPRLRCPVRRRADRPRDPALVRHLTSEIPVTRVPIKELEGLEVAPLATATPLASSRAEAIRLVERGGLRITARRRSMRARRSGPMRSRPRCCSSGVDELTSW